MAGLDPRVPVTVPLAVPIESGGGKDAVPAAFPSPRATPRFTGTLLDTMKTWSLQDIPKDSLQQEVWPWGKLASTDERRFPSVDMHKDKFTLGRRGKCYAGDNRRCPGVDGKPCDGADNCIGCDYLIAYDSVSGLHATIERVQEEKDPQPTYWLTDHSSNGTWVGGKKVGRGNRVELRNRGEIIIVPPGPNRAKISFFFFSYKSHPADEIAPEGLVAFVFTDVQSSTKLWETFPKKMDEALISHDDILRRKLKDCKGYEVKTEGDAFMVTFFSALDAMEWCLSVQEALRSHAWDPEFLKHESTAVETDPATGEQLFAGLRIRMGIHVGRPNCRRNPITGRMDYFGPTVNEAARISDSAHGGQIVCSQAVMDEYKRLSEEAAKRPSLKGLITANLGEHPYKGIKDKITVHQLCTPELRNRKFPPLRINA